MLRKIQHIRFVSSKLILRNLFKCRDKHTAHGISEDDSYKISQSGKSVLPC